MVLSVCEPRHTPPALVVEAIAGAAGEWGCYPPIDGRTTRHPGYAVSLRICKRIEQAFGRAKTVAGLRKARHRGLPKIDRQFTFAMAACNLIRLPRLLGAAT
jgi:hypothetical protein